MLNVITLQGRLTRPVELRHTQSGKAVASFSLAVDRDRKGQNGERETDFVDVVAWGTTGEMAERWLSKGDLTTVTGRLQIRDWTDKQGNKRRNAEVVALNVYFPPRRREEERHEDEGFYPTEEQFEELAEDSDFPF